jgi:hypothetical protein
VVDGSGDGGSCVTRLAVAPNSIFPLIRSTLKCGPVRDNNTFRLLDGEVANSVETERDVLLESGTLLCGWNDKFHRNSLLHPPRLWWNGDRFVVRGVICDDNIEVDNDDDDNGGGRRMTNACVRSVTTTTHSNIIRVMAVVVVAMDHAVVTVVPVRAPV